MTPPISTRANRRRARRDRPGFTLIETALTTVILGVGVLALIEAHQNFMRVNQWSTYSATGAYLAGEMREVMKDMPRHDPVTGLYVDVGGDLRGWGPEGGETSVDDFDDLDDFDGLASAGLTFRPDGTGWLDDADQPGPIDAFRAVIPQIDNDGELQFDDEGDPIGLRGWSQQVTIDKLNPFDSAVVVDDNAFLAPGPGDEGIAVDEYPLRVTVRVFFQDVGDLEPLEISRLVWIQP